MEKSIKTILVVIAVGIWAIVLQNAGIIPTNQNVKVVNEVDAYVRGSVDVDNTVDIRGSVDVDNTVDVNLEEILGYKAGCRTSYKLNGKEFVSLDVSTR